MEIISKNNIMLEIQKYLIINLTTVLITILVERKNNHKNKALIYKHH